MFISWKLSTCFNIIYWILLHYFALMTASTCTLYGQITKVLTSSYPLLFVIHVQLCTFQTHEVFFWVNILIWEHSVNCSGSKQSNKLNTCISQSSRLKQCENAAPVLTWFFFFFRFFFFFFFMYQASLAVFTVVVLSLESSNNKWRRPFHAPW